MTSKDTSERMTNLNNVAVSEQDQQKPVKDSLYEYQKRILGRELANSCTMGGDKALTLLNVQRFQDVAKKYNLPVYKLLRVCQLYDINLSTGSFELEWDSSKELDQRLNTDHPESLQKKYEITEEYSDMVYEAKSLISNQQPEQVIIKKYRFDSFVGYNALDVAMRFNHSNLIKAIDFYFDTADNLAIVFPDHLGAFLAYNEDLFKLKYSLDIRKKYISELVNVCIFLNSQGYVHLGINASNLLMLRQDESKAMSFVNSKIVLNQLDRVFPVHVTLYPEHIQQLYELNTLPLDHMLGLSVEGTKFYMFGGPLGHFLQQRELKDKGYLKEIEAAIDAKFTAYEKVNYFSTTLKQTEAWMLGNTILYLLTGQYLFALDVNDSTDDEVETFVKSIVAYIHNPVVYLTKLLSSISYSQEWLVLLQKLLNIDPTKRINDYTTILQSSLLQPYQAIVPGYSAYINLVSNITMTSKDLQLLQYGTRQILTYFKQTSNLVLPKHYYYETVFTAVELFYRASSFKPFSAEENVYCDVSQLTRSCIYLALTLSFKSSQVLFEPFCIDTTQDRGSVDTSLVTKNIVRSLNGQLRYPYLIESCVTKKEIQMLLQVAMDNPEAFINLLINPYKPFENQDQVVESFDTVDATELLSKLISSDQDDIYNHDALQELFNTNKVVQAQFQANLYFFPKTFRSVVSAINQAITFVERHSFCNDTIKEECLEGALRLLKNILTASYLQLDQTVFIRALWDFVRINIVQVVPGILSATTRTNLTNKAPDATEITKLLDEALSDNAEQVLKANKQDQLVWFLLLADVVRVIAGASRAKDTKGFDALQTKTQTKLRQFTEAWCKGNQ